MITGNIVVCIVYIAIAVLTLCLYKRSANNSTQPLTSSQTVTSKQSIALTLSKYLLNRYTILAVRHPEKKYLLAQVFTIAVLSVTLLHLNRIMFYQIGTLPLSFFIGMVINDVWMFGKREKGNTQEETDGDVIVQPRWVTMSLEQMVRCGFALMTVAMLLIAGFRVDMSLSNLGEINGLSVLIGVVIDQIVIRPVVGASIIGCFRLVEAIVGREKVMGYRVIQQIAYQQYLRDPSNQNLVFEQIKLSQIKSDEEKTSSPLKLPDIVERHSESNSNEGTLADLLNRHSSICIEEKQQVKVEDISIMDDINRLEDINTNHFDLQTSKGTDDKDQEQQIDLNILKQRNNNQDIYLANIWPSDQLELQLPDSMEISPKLKKRRINKKKRVLNLCGNSPYLQYLPNMLKKQESENKLKSMSKNNLQSKVLSGIENKK